MLNSYPEAAIARQSRETDPTFAARVPTATS